MPDYHKLRIEEIGALSKKYRVWKVFWIGELSINLRTREIMIDVCLVPLKTSVKAKNRINDERLVEGSSYRPRERAIIRIGVGQLQLVRTGTIFVDGYPAEYPKYITEKFSFRVTEDRQRIISSGEAWQESHKVEAGKVEADKAEAGTKQNYYIPASQYQVFFNSRAGGGRPYPAKCLVTEFSDPESKKHSVSLNRYPLNLYSWKKERSENAGSLEDAGEIAGDSKVPVHGLIIPCMEMIRFYYTKSSQSGREILTGGLAGDPNRMFIDKDTKPPGADGRGFLMLSDYVRNKDAPVIARYAFDDYAKSQALAIFTSQINNKSRFGAVLPDAKFPFRDVETDLKVHGTYVQSGTRVYFLVFWIESCSAPFPFKHLEFWRTNPGGMKGPQTQMDVTQPTSIKTDEMEIKGEKFGDYGEQSDENENIKKARNATGANLQNENPPSSVITKLNLLLKEDERFPSLQGVVVEARKPKPNGEKERASAQGRLIFAGGDEEGMETAGTAPKGGAGSITPISITPETRQSESPDSLADDPPELEEITYPHIYQKEVNLPELEKLYSEQADEKDKVYGLHLEDESGGTGTGGDRLAVDLGVFTAIINSLKKAEPQLEIQMIKVPPDGEPTSTTSGTTFPSRWHSADIDTAEAGNASQLEIYIAEIKNETNHYAYLMDIKAVEPKNRKKKKGFQMFVCFEGKEHRKLKGFEMRTILELCETRNYKWMENNLSNKKAKTDTALSYIIRTKFKHDCNSIGKYADRLLKALRKEEWLPNKKTG